MPRLHSGAAIDRPEVTHLILPPIPEVVCQQPQENHVNNIHNDLTKEIQNDTHTPRQKNDVEAQTSPIKETSPQKSGSDTESSLENQTRRIPVQCLDDSNKQQNEIQQNQAGLTAYVNGDDNILPPEITTSRIREQLVRDENTNELYMPLCSTIVLKRKKEMLYVPLDFENGLTIDALVDSGAYVSAIDRKIAVRVTNTTESPYTINRNTQIAEFSVVTPEQSKFIKPVDMAILSMVPQGDPDLVTYLTELLKTNKPDQQNNTFWFPTPENPGNTEDHTPIQTRILTELSELQRREKLNPKDDSESQTEFLKGFDWTDTLLTEIEKQAVEDILVEYHDIFARHRMDIGMNTEFKVKLTPKDDKTVYSQSLPMPIHLKENLIIELALIHKYGIITVLPFSKYASPIFAQRKPNGKSRLLVDLRKINTLIADDYTNNNHPVSTLPDAAQHLAGKSLFCKLDCSQAYHCLQKTDQRSVEMLAFNFVSRTFAYRRLAQGLSRSVSAFSSFMREYLDPVVKADQFAQYVDDIGIAANNARDLTRNIRAVFQCIRNAGMKLTIEKCHFGVRQVEFLGRTVLSEGVSPQTQKIQNFLNKLRFPKSKKDLQRYLGFVNYYRNYIPRQLYYTSL